MKVGQFNKTSEGDASATISSHNPGPRDRKRAAPADADAKCPPKRSRPCKSMSVIVITTDFYQIW